MNTYKITNITNLVGKRDSKFNSVVNIEYVDNRTKKTIVLKAGENVFLTVQSLPLSVHRLRIKKLIDVLEVSPAELKKSIEKLKPKPKTKALRKFKVKKPVIEKEVVETKEPITITKKTTTRRKKTVE
jgi:hypothetical protein